MLLNDLLDVNKSLINGVNKVLVYQLIVLDPKVVLSPLPGILEEIRHYSADILCIQEVEKEQFNEFFKVEFEKDGYEGVYAPKSRFQTMSEDGQKRVDGCAIFWRTHK